MTSSKEKILRIINVIGLAATGLIHWFLPAIHPGLPTELTGGLIKISHETLHVLFNLNGVGYLILMGVILDWFPVRPKHMKYVYLVIAGFALATIIAWVLLSDPTERSAVDYVDKAIEVVLTATAIWMFALMTKEKPQPETH